MKQSSSTEPPVTEVDLALYSENLLNPSRSMVVREFLLAAGLSDGFDAAAFDSNDSLNMEAPDETSGHVSGMHGSSESNSETDSDRPSVNPDPEDLSGSRLSRRLLIRSVIVLSILLIAVRVGTQGFSDVRAIEATLESTEKLLSSDNPVLSPQVSKSREALERLEGSFWLRGRNSVRRDRLLASIYLAQAELELNSHTVLDFHQEPAFFPPLELCEKARELLLRDDLSDRAVYRSVVKCCFLNGRVYYLFGILSREKDLADHSHRLLAIAADSFLSGLESIPPAAGSFRHEMLIECGGLLLKSLLKGGAKASPFRSLRGREVSGQANMERLIALIPRLRSNGSSLVELAPEFLRLVAESDSAMRDQQQVAAHMDICNSAGLILARRIQGMSVEQRKQTASDAIMAYERGLELAGHVPIVHQSEQYALTRGRLLGNIADAWKQIGDLNAELTWRDDALRVFTAAQRQYRTEPMFFEVSWLAGRQLIAAYRYQVRNPKEKSEVPYYLGMIGFVKDEPATFFGSQLTAAEQELVCAILAEQFENNSLGRGAAAILLDLQLTNKNQVTVNVRDLRHTVLDFEQNSYLNTVPGFRKAVAELKAIQAEQHSSEE